MATNWIVPTGKDLAKVLTVIVRNKANQNLDENTKDGDPVNPDEPDRQQAQVDMVVARLRANVGHASRFPLSLTAGSIPPEAEQYVLQLAAYGLITSTPNLQLAIMEQMKDLLQKWKDEGEKYIAGIGNGEPVTTPSDPTGQDYLTAVSATNPLPSLVHWENLYYTDVDFARGYTEDSDGNQTPLPAISMTTN